MMRRQMVFKRLARGTMRSGSALQVTRSECDKLQDLGPMPMLYRQAQPAKVDIHEVDANMSGTPHLRHDHSRASQLLCRHHPGQPD